MSVVQSMTSSIEMCISLRTADIGWISECKLRLRCGLICLQPVLDLGIADEFGHFSPCSVRIAVVQQRSLEGLRKL